MVMWYQPDTVQHTKGVTRQTWCDETSDVAQGMTAYQPTAHGAATSQTQLTRRQMIRGHHKQQDQGGRHTRVCTVWHASRKAIVHLQVELCCSGT